MPQRRGGSAGGEQAGTHTDMCMCTNLWLPSGLISLTSISFHLPLPCPSAPHSFSFFLSLLCPCAYLVDPASSIWLSQILMASILKLQMSHKISYGSLFYYLYNCGNSGSNLCWWALTQPFMVDASIYHIKIKSMSFLQAPARGVVDDIFGDYR